MSRPAFSFMIGAQEWSVFLVKKVKGGQGECQKANSRILVQIGPPDQMRDTLLHEIIHACLYVSGVDADFSDKEEERVVRSLAPLLDAVLDWKLRLPV